MIQRATLTALAVSLLAGCPSFTNLKTARALDQGEFQLTVAPEVVGLTVTDNSNGLGTGTGFLPQFEIAGRYGVLDGFDVGFKLWLAGAEFDTTIQLLRGGFNLALAPGIGFFGVTTGSDSNGNDTTVTDFPIYVPLLAGINFGPGHQFVFGPEAIFLFASGSNNDVTTSNFVLFVGGTVGVSLKVAPGFRVQPEFNLYAPVAGGSSTNANGTGIGSASFLNSGVFIYQIALGFSWGGDGFREGRGNYPPAPGYYAPAATRGQDD